MKMTQTVRGHVALTAVQFLFGFFPIFGVLAFMPGGFSPLGVGAWRILFGAVVLGTLARVRDRERSIPRKSDLSRFAACGILGVALNQGLFLVGLSNSTPMNAGIVMSLIPVFTFAVAAASGQERFAVRRLLGVGLGLIGTVPLVFGGGLGDLGRYGWGNLLMVCNALAYSCYLVLSKPLTERYSALTVTAWAYLISLVAVPLFLLDARMVPDSGNLSAWWSLGYILVFPTVIAYLMNMYALARVRASTTAVYVYSQPIITGLASWAIFEEMPTLGMVGAAAAVFAGIYLVSRSP